MSLLYDSRWRALDSAGNPISGAALTVYTAGTTTPAAIYRDAALAAPMTNPTTGADLSDSAGRFPQIYGTSGAIYDVLLKSSAGGATIASYLSVSPLGASSGAQSYDFTTSRMALRGAAGISYVEAGDPVGDDVGGKLTLGGWNGTQADEIDINAVLVNIIGRLKEGGYRLPGVVRSPGVSFSGALTVDIPLTNDPTGVRAFDIEIIDLIAATANDALALRFSYDGGATYVSTSVYLNTSNYAIGVTPASTGNLNLTTSGLISTALNTQDANVPGMLKMRISTPNAGNMATVAMGQMMGAGKAATAAPGIYHFAVTAAAGAGRATHVRIFASLGNISGVYRVIPVRGFGET